MKLCTWALANRAEYPTLHRSGSTIGQTLRTNVSMTQYNLQICPEIQLCEVRNNNVFKFTRCTCSYNWQADGMNHGTST